MNNLPRKIIIYMGVVDEKHILFRLFFMVQPRLFLWFNRAFFTIFGISFLLEHRFKYFLDNVIHCPNCYLWIVF